MCGILKTKLAAFWEGCWIFCFWRKGKVKLKWESGSKRLT